MLAAAGWAVQDCRQGQPRARRGASPSASSCSKPPHGRADYLLFVDGKAVGVDRGEAGGHDAHRRRVAVGEVPTGLPGRASALPIEPLPFAYESTGVETRFTNGLDPDAAEPRGVLVPPARDARRAGCDDCVGDPLAPTLRAPAPAAARRSTRRASGRRRSAAIRNLEASLAEDRPRALIQMATGSGKTFTAANIAYRLIKYADARAGPVPRRPREPRPADAEGVPAVRHARRRPQVHRALQRAAPRARTRSTRSRASTITTIQRLYSMLRGEAELDRGARRAVGASSSSPPQPVEVDYNPAIPIETFDVDHRRRVPPLDLRRLAAGARVLRRLPDRPHRHAGEADVRLLQPEPRDGVRPRAGRRRRRQRRLRRLPDPHRDHRAGLARSRPASSRSSATARPAQIRLEKLDEDVVYDADGSSTATSSPRTRSARSSAPSRSGSSPRSSPAAPRCRRR